MNITDLLYSTLSEEEGILPETPETIDMSQGNGPGIDPVDWTRADDEGYKEWYSTNHERWGLDPDPAREEEWYDFRSAYKKGVSPTVDVFGNVVWPKKYQRKVPKKLLLYKDTSKSDKTPTIKELQANNEELKEPEIAPEPLQVVNIKDLIKDQELKQMSMADPSYWARQGEQLLRAASEGVRDTYKFLYYREIANTLQDRLNEPFQIDYNDVKASMIFTSYLDKFREVNGRAPSNEEWQRMRIIYEANLQQMNLEDIQKVINFMPQLLPGTTGVFEDIVVSAGRFSVSLGLTPVSPGAAFLMSSMQIAGAKAEELVAQGYDPETAVKAGSVLGLMQGAVEIAGNEALFKVVSKWVGKVFGSNPITGRLIGYLAAVGTSTFTEGAEEFIQENQEIVFNYVLANPDMTPLEVMKWMSGHIPELYQKHKKQLGKATGLGGGAGALMAALIGGGKLSLQTKQALKDYKIYREEVVAPKKIAKKLFEEAARLREEKKFYGEVKPSEKVRYDIAKAETTRRETLKKMVEAGKISEARAKTILKHPTELEKMLKRERVGIMEEEGEAPEQYLKEIPQQQLSVRYPNKIRAAAIKVGDTVYEGKAHFEIANKNNLDVLRLRPEQEGFVTTEGKFVTREEAAKIVGLRTKPFEGAKLVSEQLQLKAKPIWQQTAKKIAEDIGAEGRVYIDNPGGDWLAHERSKAAEGGGSSKTGSIDKITLPIDMLTGLPGRNREHELIKEDDARVKELAEKIKKEGFTSAPFLNVEYDGSVNVNEGNHRIRAAKIAGLTEIPVEIGYYAGGERIEGPFSLENLASLNITKKAPTVKKELSIRNVKSSEDLKPLTRKQLLKMVDDFRQDAGVVDEIKYKDKNIYNQTKDNIIAWFSETLNLPETKEAPVQRLQITPVSEEVIVGEYKNKRDAAILGLMATPEQIKKVKSQLKNLEKKSKKLKGPKLTRILTQASLHREFIRAYEDPERYRRDLRLEVGETIERTDVVDSTAKASPSATNVLVRGRYKNLDPKNKVLFVQFSAETLKENFKDEGADYYDLLYSKRKGYWRPNDFWEIPQWVAEGAAMLPKSDVMIIRSPKAAAQALNKLGYGTVFFSAMDVNKSQIKQIAKEYNGQIIVGGYVESNYFKGSDNVIVVDEIEDAAKAIGLPVKKGVDYGHFRGEKTIPRLCMSTGCKHKCAFCTVSKEIGPQPKSVISNQVGAFKDLKFKYVYLDDKTFGQSPNYQDIIKVYEQIKSFNKSFEGFIVQTTAPQLLKLDDEFLEKAHIRFVELGMESFNDDILKKIHKPHNTALLTQATEKLREANIALIPNVIVGLSGKNKDGSIWSETKKTYQNTLNYLNENNDIISHVNVYNLALYAGTDLGDQIEVESDTDVNENVIEKSYHKDPALHKWFYGEVINFAKEQLQKEPGKIVTKEESVALTKSKIKERAAELEKAGVAVGRGPHRKSFLVSVGEKSGTIYGPAKKGDEKVVRKRVHPLYGTMEVTEYYRTIKGIRYKVINAPILPKAQAKRDALLDKLIKDYEHEVGWYEKWIDWMRQFQKAGISDELITKYIKMQGVLSRAASPAGAQTLFGNAIKQLEENGSVQAGPGKGFDFDSKKKLEAIWYGQDKDIRTLAEFQAYYGDKIGAMIFTSLDPRTTEEFSVVIDRHMPRLWGYNIMWTAQGATGFRVTKELRREIVKDISRASTRNNIPIAGIQAALWYAIGAGHTGTATHFEESAAVSPREALGRRLFTATTMEPQQIIHWHKRLLYTVRGAKAPERLTAKDETRLSKLEEKSNPEQGNLFGITLTDEENRELVELRTRKEGEKPNPWSKNDVIKRMEAATPHTPYMPLGYWYAGGVRRESFFQGMEPHLTSIYEDEIYDADKDLLGYKEKVQEFIKNDPLFKKGARTPEQLYSNALAYLIWKTGDYKGFSVSVWGDPWIMTFDEVPIEQKGTDVQIAISDKVTHAVNIPDDINDAIKVTSSLIDAFDKSAISASQDFALKSYKSTPVMGRFEGINEHSLAIDVKGPMDAVRAYAALMGLSKHQDVVFVFNTDNQGLRGTMIEFGLDADISTIQSTIEKSGLSDYTLAMKGGTPTLRVWIESNSETSNLISDQIETIFDKIGKEGSMNHQEVWSEVIGAFGGGEAAKENYKSHLVKHLGKTRGEKLYAKAEQEGIEWAANATQQFTTALGKAGLYEKYADQQPGSFSEINSQDQADIQSALNLSTILKDHEIKTVEKAMGIVREALSRFNWPSEIAKNLKVVLAQEITLGKLSPEQLETLQESLSAHEELGVTPLDPSQFEITGWTGSTGKLYNSLLAVSYFGRSDINVEMDTYHEMWHVLEGWLIPEAVLQQMIKIEPNIETRANDFADFMMDTESEKFSKTPHWWKNAWMRIVNLIRRIKRKLFDEGYKSLDDVYSDALIGMFRPKGSPSKAPFVKKYSEPALPITTGSLTISQLNKMAEGQSSMMVHSTEEQNTNRWINEIPSSIEMPELVQLVADILDGKYPAIKAKFRKKGSLGIFFPGRETVKLSAEIFKDPKLASAVLGHEIGHVIDWLPDKDLGRGNILGRIASLKRYMKKTLPLEPGAPGELTEKDRIRLRLEAKKLITEAARKVKWVDEFIEKESPITPQNVLDIWNSVEDAKLFSPELYDFISRLNAHEKKLIVKAALKGVVAEELKRFAGVVAEPTGRKIPVTMSPSDEDIRKKYAELINEEIKKRRLWSADEIMGELKVLTRLWRPFDPGADPKYTKYRYSSTELYADAISVLFNDPRLLKFQAPKFYEAFFRYMSEKPEIYAEYNKIQDHIKSGKIEKDRTERIYDMFREGNNLYLRDIDAERDSIKDGLKRDLIDSYHYILKDIKSVGERNVDPTLNPRYKIEQLSYTGSEVELYLTEMNHKVMKPLKEANLEWDREFGLMVFLRRVALEREDLANPQGWNKKLALEKIKELEGVELSPAQLEKLNEALDNFRMLHERFFIDRAEEAEVFDSKMIELFRDREAYATFDVQPYLAKRYGRAVGMKIYQQIGTLQKIANPATATMMKDIGFIKAVNRNEAIRSVVRFYLEHQRELPGTIEPARKAWNGRFQEIQEPDDPAKGLLVYLHKGKAQGYYVPKQISEAFEMNPISAWTFSKILGWTAKPFRMIFTELNYGFWIVNAFFRDFQRGIMALPKANVASFTKHYVRGIKPAFRSVFGVPDAVVQEMQAGNMLISIADFRGMTTEDKQLERLMKMYHMMPGKFNSKFADKLQKPWGTFFNYIGNAFKKGEFYMSGVGRSLERTTKVAGYTYMKEKFPDMPQEAIGHIVRTRAGSPDFLRLGRAHSIYNNLLLFSNAMKEGYRGDIEAWSDNPTEFMRKKVMYTLTPKLLMWAAAAGLLGMGLKQIFRGVSEYDLTNYIIIPLGLTKSGKSVYFRVPTDETSRLFGGIFWKLLNHKELGGMDFTTGLADYMAGQAPTTGPFFSVAADIVSYASGKNPYNAFYGRHALNDQVMTAGGMRAHEQFAMYLLDQLGASIVYKFPYDDVDRVAEEIESLFGFPIKSPVADWMIKLPKEPVASNMFGRFLKVSDYGIKEELKRKKRIIRRGKMRDILDAKDAIIKLVNDDKLDKKDIIALLKKPDLIDRNILAGLSKKFGNVYLEEYLSSTSKEEQAYVLLQMIKDRSLPPTVFGPKEEAKKPTKLQKELKIYNLLKKEGF